MKRIKHARLGFYSCIAGSPDFRLPEVVEANDLHLLLAVARAAEKLAASDRIYNVAELKAALVNLNRAKERK